MKQRWLIVISILVTLGAGVWFALPDAPGIVSEGDQVTDLNLPDLQGAMQTFMFQKFCLFCKVILGTGIKDFPLESYFRLDTEFPNQFIIE